MKCRGYGIDQITKHYGKGEWYQYRVVQKGKNVGFLLTRVLNTAEEGYSELRQSMKDDSEESDWRSAP